MPIRQQGSTSRGIQIEDDVWIGHGCSILDGVVIGRGAIVAAGSVVTKNVPSFAVVGGVPARVLKQRWEAGTGPHVGDESS
jgi:acetyltransferase-like isoleucine patch superfamily enzyme